MYNSKKTGIAPNTIIRPRVEELVRKKKERLEKMNTCRKCKYFYNKDMICNKYGFRVSTIEIGITCRHFENIKGKKKSNIKKNYKKKYNKRNKKKK